MIFEAEFDIRESWQAATSRRAWLKQHEDELRRIAAQTGWANVAELLESRGWSGYWGVRPLSAEIIAREFAQIAFRRRRRAPKPALSDRRLAAAVADEFRHGLGAVLRAELQELFAAPPAAQPQPAPAEPVPERPASSAPPPATGQIKVRGNRRRIAGLILDPAKRAAALAGVAEHTPISTKEK
jgi:hypothetical protein